MGAAPSQAAAHVMVFVDRASPKRPSGDAKITPAVEPMRRASSVIASRDASPGPTPAAIRETALWAMATRKIPSPCPVADAAPPALSA